MHSSAPTRLERFGATSSALPPWSPAPRTTGGSASGALAASTSSGWSAGAGAPRGERLIGAVQPSGW
eukprot:7632930-Alexandrium_andersonii.AAC.1